MQPLIKWSGGKSREIKYFRKYYPKYFYKFMEPFVGSGAVFFDLEFSNNLISDTHDELINFYIQIQLGNGSKIYELMSRFPNNEETYYFIRDEFIPQNDVERAFVFFFLRKTCYRGMLRYNKKGKFNIPYGRYRTINYELLLNDSYRELLSRTDIMGCSYKKIFEDYNSSSNFIFLDPPYDSTFTNYGFSTFGKQEHAELHDYFVSTKNKCLLVIGKTDFIVKLYRKYVVEEYDKKYAFKIHSNRVGSEIDNKHLIIVNY